MPSAAYRSPKHRGGWRELADALASWAATYRELLRRPSCGERQMPPRQAIMKVPVIPPERRKQGNIVASLAMLDELSGICPGDRADRYRGRLDSLLAELTEILRGSTSRTLATG